ncbi:O-antigen ligase family protein [Arenibacter algicola]|uniref:O-antigen ligase-related domain-containing protein n=1 Tax=Arenibacter algicola TaxID=616991 RepID=A0A221UUW8_9FLAO|nr:O-antigen ligase family protein [Arenibacter algicola]ASO04886.1 hypothetical protein AREALGSMS7_01416 [Arenibacter algicola]
MKLKSKYIYYLLVLLPFILVFISEIISFRNQHVGSIFKLAAICYMLLYSLFHLKFEKKLIISIAVFLPIFFFHIIISFNINAAIEEAIRYFFPIIVLMYGFTIRKYYLLIIYFIIGYGLINNCYQLIVYINWLRDVPVQWFYLKVVNSDIYYYNSTMGVIRAVGLLGFFAVYGFLNLISFFLTRNFYHGKYKNTLLTIFAFGVLSSLSFKAIGVFLFLLLLLSNQKIKLLIGILFLVVFSIVLFPQKSLDFSNQLTLRIKTYITEGNSARAESYKVMFNDMADFRLMGRGIGSFGGASSTHYDSPVYDEVNFNWYKTPYLATTDTYFPHVFVEMGILGGLLYFLVIMSPIMKRYYSKNVLLMLFTIYVSLFFDSLFSFALNNLAYLMLSLIFIYPILEYDRK